MKVFFQKYGLITIFVIWSLLHIPGIIYGTKNLPLHQSYVGDEQAPVNGALHILSDKSFLGLRNLKTVYYGPVFSIIALPGILADFSYRYISGEISGAEDYKNFIIWDWGGIVIFIRIIAVLSSLAALYFIYRVFSSATFNPQKRFLLALVPTILVAFNFYFFQYSHFFKHWTFIILFFIAQIYISIRMHEDKGENVLNWWWHGILTVAIFGVSYVGAIYVVAFVPLLFEMLMIRKMRSRVLWYFLAVLVGCFVVIWWHPYAFIRYLGLLSIGEINTLNGSQNPFAFGQTSFGYYGGELILNNLPIILAMILLLYLWIRNHFTFRAKFVWMYLSVAIINFMIFAPAVHHEGRYMLPTIILIILLTTSLYLAYISSPKSKVVLVNIIAVLFSIYILFHVIHVIKWLQIWSKGPLEKQAISQILELQKTGTPVLLVQGYIAGHPHTKESYAYYTEKTNKQNVNLYKEIMNTQYPDNVDLLDVRYLAPNEFMKDLSIMKKYRHVVLKFDLRPEEINQFDFFDENILRLWYFDDYYSKYIFLK